MATSGTIQGTTKNSSGADRTSQYGTWISWVSNSRNITNNTSNITVSVSTQRIDSYSGETVWDLITKPTVDLKVGGAAKSATISHIDTRNHRVSTFATWTGDVTHNANGTLNLSLECSWTLPSTPLASGYISGAAALDTIPRASTISAVSGTTIGSDCTVTISRADASFTHQLWYKVGNSGWYDLKTGIGTEKVFTIDIETAKQLPNAMDGTMQLCVRTFNGTTQIGSDYYHDVTVSVPDYTMSGKLVLTGQSLLSGAYVQGKSKLLVDVDDLVLYYGANVKSITSTVDGKTYNGIPFTSDVLSSGSKTVITTITDTRGKQLKLTSSAFTVYAYATPSITEFTLVRQDDGTTVIATVKGSVSAVNNKNAKTIQVTLNGVTQTITSNTYSINGTTTFTNVPTDNTLTSVAKIIDSYTHATREFVLPTVAVTMDFHNSGKGIAMGKVSETSDLLDIAWSARVRKNLTVNGTHTVDGATNLNKAATISDNDWKTLMLKRVGAVGAVTIQFQNNTGSLGYIGMTGSELNTPLRRWSSDGATQYTVLDSAFVKDYVVEQGTSGIWTYRKWNSGLAECWGVYTMTSAATKTWGSLYYSDTLAPRINYPFTFTSRPQESAFLHGSSVAGWVYPEAGGIGLNTTTQTGQYGFVRPTSIASSEVKYEYTVVGKWK